MQLESLVVKGVQEARSYIQEKRRERALLALRKNKLYEHNLDKIDAYLLNVEQVRFAGWTETATDSKHASLHLALTMQLRLIPTKRACAYAAAQSRGCVRFLAMTAGKIWIEAS